MRIRYRRRQGEAVEASRRSLPLPHESVRRRLELDLRESPASTHWWHHLLRGAHEGSAYDDVWRRSAYDALAPRRPRSRFKSRVDSFWPLRVLRVEVPREVAFCVKRKQRREALFARRQIGFSGSSRGRRRFDGRYYRRTVESAYGC